MGIRNETRAWVEASLFEGGYTEIMTELTIHTQGPDDHVIIGCQLTDPATREPIAITTQAITGSLRDTQAIGRNVAELLNTITRMLEPFGASV